MNYLICGYLGYDNLGDELMAQAISSSVFARDKSARVVFFAPKGKKYENFDCINRHSPLQIFKSIKKCDVFILGGGTLISEEASKRSALYYTAMLTLAGIMKKRRMIWSGGIDRIKSKFLKFILKRQLKSVKISLRDTPSLDALWQILPCPSAKIHSDPVFLLVDSYIRAPITKRSPKYVVVCLKNDAPKDLAIMIGELCRKYSLTAVFAATTPKDMPVCETQSALINGKAMLLSDIEGAKSLFESAALCLSMRYHAILLSACFGCVPVCMSPSEKVLALMREMCLDDLILPSVYSYEKYEKTLERVLNLTPKYEYTCKNGAKEMLRRAVFAEAFLLDLNFLV